MGFMAGPEETAGTESQNGLLGGSASALTQEAHTGGECAEQMFIQLWGGGLGSASPFVSQGAPPASGTLHRQGESPFSASALL